MPSSTAARAALAAAAVLFGITILGGAGYLFIYQPRLGQVAVSTSAVALPSASAAAPTGQANGQWSVTGGSFAGYRVREQLAQLTAPSDAVGRTSAVTGGLTLALDADGSGSVSNIKVQADLSQLQSDSQRRDGFISGNYLETDRYPTATFSASDPVAVERAVIDGAEGTIKVSGQWSIHGQTKAAAIDLKVRRNGDKVEAVGSYGFQWGDFGVSRPQTQSATVKGDPVIEFSLVLRRATPA